MLGSPRPKFDKFQPILVKINQSLFESRFLLTEPINPTLLFDAIKKNRKRMNEHFFFWLKTQYDGEKKKR